MTTQSGHIAFVCPRFAEGATVGGAETLIRNIAMKTVSSGRRVTFLTTCARDHFTWKNDIEPGIRNIDGMNVHFLPVDTNRDLSTFMSVQRAISSRCQVSPDDEMKWLKNNVNSSALCEHIRQHGPEYDRIVMGPYLFGLIFFAAQIFPSRTLLVPCLHDEAFAYLTSFRQMFTSVRGFLFNSEPERDLAKRLYNVNMAASSVIGMGLDDFASDGARFTTRLNINTPYMIYCGRREAMKGTPLLLDYLHAFRSRTKKDIKLVLTGAGKVEIPHGLAGSVLDVGFLDEQNKHDAMAGAITFCHPSINESFGIVLMESWLARTPALVHAKSEVLKYHCRQSNGGMWFKNYPEFEEELLLLLGNTSLRNAMGHAGREYVLKKYSWDSIQPKLLEALDR